MLTFSNLVSEILNSDVQEDHVCVETGSEHLTFHVLGQNTQTGWLENRCQLRNQNIAVFSILWHFSLYGAELGDRAPNSGEWNLALRSIARSLAHHNGL